MRHDQFERLQSLSEQLTDVLIDELDTKRWPGDGIQLAAMDRDTRGDRYWTKRNAGMTLTVLTKLHTLVEITRRGTTVPEPTDDEDQDLETEIAGAEREAQKLIERALSHAKTGRRRK